MQDQDVDNSVAADLTSDNSSAQSTDTAPAESASADTPSSDPSAQSSAEAGSAVADNPTDDGQQAPSQGNTEANAAPPPSAPDYERQYKAIQSWATKQRQENLDLQRQLKELQQQVQAHQQKQSEPQLRPWDEGHAEHAQFLRLVDKAEYFDELIQGEDNPEVIKAIQQKQLRVLGEQGIQTLREWRDDVRRQERERRLNPKAFYSKLIRQEAQPVVQETLQSTSQNYQQMIQAREQAQKWVQGNPEVATPDNIRSVLKLMEQGATFDQASAMVERDHYRSQVSSAQRKSASAEEKERLLQGKAAGAIHRSPNATSKLDIKKFMAEKGMDKMDSRARLDAYFDLDKDGLL